ncbi:electron transport complex subunit E [Clostridium sp. CM028]|uniref:RnfABCDGE type electron transport complex subunit E n=1 Tax=unclassified Clostridium TaxID=2614128 RepID=UPI001C0E3775|nr:MULTISPECIES: electron transport complex subunit E [unclassified Clostridium]MBU3090949.1 electron transport complex subunit E [Clostridium sp. CF011]MBW9144485.1 electron transport complex subunit E [Clostridium sp. CM027]MBW9147984.1 electron transport complex subunit E [Clostridium sp. CM028]UVE40742.1 electron transport complex subunit E [Clostridium sp. CM027]WAG69713.1 electron transport complex subunit E [Clostridium sp. CF011]
MSVFSERLKNGIVTENPIFVQVLAMCPTLAVTTSVKNGIGMGLASTAVLIFSNLFISLLRNAIPDKVRIPAYITIIAAFVTLIQFLLQGFVPSLYKSLGIFIPLIVVNCVILGRAESYASKHKALPSIFDAIGMGLGFTVALAILGAIRELLGAGSIYGFKLLGASFQPAIIMVLAPGAFITLGILMALLNQKAINQTNKVNDKIAHFHEIDPVTGACTGCGSCAHSCKK